jgi:hypothetical protein
MLLIKVFCLFVLLQNDLLLANFKVWVLDKPGLEASMMIKSSFEAP